MAPKTRRSAGGSGPGQSTLSFKNKITKSSTSTTDAAAHKKAQKLNEPAQEQVVEAAEIKQTTPEPEEAEARPTDSPVQVTIRASPGKPTTAIPDSPKRRRKVRKSSEYETDPSSNYAEAEAAAQKISDNQIKKYWKAEEDSRLAPRVHQSALPLYEKILRHFDLSSQFGPCIGIPRLSRWKRAQSLGQSPPVEVLAVLLKEEAAEKKGEVRQCGKLAYIDELAGGRVVLVE